MPEVIGNLDAVLDAVRQRVDKRIQATEEEARRRASHILEEARSQAEQRRQEILAEARRQAEQERRHILAQAELAAQQERLRARDALLRQVWQEAERHLRAMTEDVDTYASVLERLTFLALRVLGPVPLLLFADPRGHALLTRERLARWSQKAMDHFGQEIALAPGNAPADTWGGLIAREQQGRRQVDATFPTRLALAWEILREEIFAILEEPT